MEATITALAPWFGSKRTLAPEIVRELGVHRTYWEPFCGSCAVLLAKEPCVMETVNDLHGDLINLARVLRVEDLAVDLYGRLARLVFHEDLFDEAREAVQPHRNTAPPEDPDVDRAEAFMVVSWFGRNGVIGSAGNNNNFCVRYTSNGGHAATRWQSVVSSIPAWHARLRNVTILGRDAFKLIERIGDEDGSVVYCDPPYVVKGAKYIHDFASDDHGRLAELLRRFRKTRVVVSYYDHPTLAELYPRWSKRRLKANKALSNQGKRDQVGSTEAPEVLLINGSSVTSSGGLF